MREALLWEDEPLYIDHPKGFINLRFLHEQQHKSVYGLVHKCEPFAASICLLGNSLKIMI